MHLAKVYIENDGKKMSIGHATLADNFDEYILGAEVPEFTTDGHIVNPIHVTMKVAESNSAALNILSKCRPMHRLRERIRMWWSNTTLAIARRVLPTERYISMVNNRLLKYGCIINTETCK